MGFKVTDRQIELIETRDPAEDFVLFGVRACDCRSFDVLDRVFLSEPVDSYYQSRREHGTVITMACTRPAETCFCGTFGIDATNPAGDVSCWMEGEALYWRANTPKGEALTAQLPMLSDCDAEAVEAQQTATRAILAKLPLADLRLEGFDGEHMLSLFESPKWAELHYNFKAVNSIT